MSSEARQQEQELRAAAIAGVRDALGTTLDHDRASSMVDAVLAVYAERLHRDEQTRLLGFDGYSHCPHGSCPTPYRCSERGDCPVTTEGHTVVFVETFFALKRAWDITIEALDILAHADDEQTGRREAFELAVSNYGVHSSEAMRARAELHPERALARVIARTARAMLPEIMPREI